MKTPHIHAEIGDFAETILLPGDPLRAKYIAENYLKDAKLVTSIRNILGYTGTYNGKKVSVMGTGMGVPSISIYATELARFFGVKNLIRIGSCGAISEKLELKDIVIGNSASTNSDANRARFGRNVHFSAAASYTLVNAAAETAKKKNIKAVVGAIFTSDLFYGGDISIEQFQKMGILGVEMEAAGLYGVAIEEQVRALTIVAVSDHIVKKTEISAEDRETALTNMITLALETAITL